MATPQQVRGDNKKTRNWVARFFAPGRCGVGTKSQLLGSKVGLQAALFCSPYAVVPAREGDGRLGDFA